MPFRYIDTHCHLDSPVYERDLDVVIKHAREEGVGIVTLGSDLASSRRAVEIAEKYPDCVFAAVGLHPKHVAEEGHDLTGFTELLAHPQVVAIGETGLDYHDLPRNQQLAEAVADGQRKAFGRFLGMAREHRLPLLLHCRDAHEDMLTMLDNWDKTAHGLMSRGIVHCFSGDLKTSRRYADLGFMISVTGILTHGAYQTEVIRKAPAGSLVVESDCPHATITPWSLRRNEPSYLPIIADTAAAIRGTSPAQFAADTTANALKTFLRMPRQ